MTASGRGTSAGRDAPLVAASRRELLRVAGAAGLSSILGNSGCAHREPRAVSYPEDAGGPAIPGPLSSAVPMGPAFRVPTRAFGRSGESVSALALGGYFDAIENQALLDEALALGITFWEVTLSFGAKGHGQYFLRHPEARRKVFLLAKTNGASLADMDRDLEKTLSDAATSYVDLFIIGSISDGAILTSEVRHWVEAAKASGKIRYFGFSTHNNMEACLETASRLDWIDGVLTTYNYRLMQRSAMQRAVDACAARGIAVTAIKSQALETNPVASIGEETEAAAECLRRHLSRGHDLFQARLRAVWDNPQIASVCSMMTDSNILRANARAALGTPGGSPAGTGTAAPTSARPSHSYCAGCASVCEGALPAPLPVADVMRFMMYARGYGDSARAHRELAALSPAVRTALARQDYELAERRCPEQLPIGRLVREALETL